MKTRAFGMTQLRGDSHPLAKEREESGATAVVSVLAESRIPAQAKGGLEWGTLGFKNL